MPPRRGESIERNEAHEDFIKKVAEYHEKRGTNFDPEPKVGVRHIDLLKLYERVVGEGGYDLVSDTKAKPLMWRRFAEEFVGKNQYTAAQAFQIKNVYYKNLCAYEIATHWEKEPPPKEILEEVTAKGGGVMTRTLENFERPAPREQVNLDNEDSSDTSPQQQQTPKEEKVDEDPSSASGRTRGLRQQPPQRMLFQPDLTAGRQTRGQMQQTTPGSPAPQGSSANGAMNTPSFSNGASSTLAAYEPSQSYPLSLKPVTTPANNPEFYRQEKKRKLDAKAGPLSRKYRHIMLPGTGFIGPNIYVRAQLALQSGIPEEEQYALHHLVKISHERGDKYRFDQFPGLAEALVKKVLQVSSLFYDVDWDVSYDEEMSGPDDEVLNGLYGTSDAIQKLRSRIRKTTNDHMHDEAFLSQLNRISEAGLIIRNMCMLNENAQYLSAHPLIRDYLAIVLDLPQHSHIIELRHYALETAEQVLKYCDLGPDDALYHSLLDQLWGQDRGAITLALRTISRIAMHLEPPKRLEDVPDDLLQRVQDWLLVEDEELRSACLDFFIQYTSFADNVDNLLQAVDSEGFARQLSRLLFFAAKENKSGPTAPKPRQDDTPDPVPRLSRPVVETLLKLDEPERSSEWLRMCFVSDPNTEMTQISLWQAYQATFAPYQATHTHLVAGDFIKNVSTTFTGATAQVSTGRKYVITGIKARKVPLDSGATPGSRPTDKGKELLKCCWTVQIRTEGQRDPLTGIQPAPTFHDGPCAEWFRTEQDILRHILDVHLRLPRKRRSPDAEDRKVDKMELDSPASRPPTASGNRTPNGTSRTTFAGDLDFQEADATMHRCRWAGCTRTSTDFAASKAPRTVFFVRHVHTHLPNSEHSATSKHNVRSETKPVPPQPEFTKVTTLQDDIGHAAGVPLSAALVLRNIAKFFPKPEAIATDAITGIVGGKKEAEVEPKEDDLLHRVFDDEVEDRLFLAMAQNEKMKELVGTILWAVKAKE
ncbi:Chromatin structure-remodeling complex protein rsc9 [Saxophila tyrrhenica]|uniref:Chromatin structure-remodeling complex protein rsc9 n=1 Tax=Saxophila tyrrhenica TaxID=1690608 RepID=A0AAV9P357_9PEZI|nr:Chromatin structure-remodeling complex protein rsc9 [Saxophila tyrrhenica]